MSETPIADDSQTKNIYLSQNNFVVEANLIKKEIKQIFKNKCKHENIQGCKIGLKYIRFGGAVSLSQL